MNKGGQGEIYLYQNVLNDRFKIAGRLKTNLMAFALKDGYFPTGVPESQTYDLEITYNMTDKIEVTLIEGCKHYFSQSGLSRYNDNEYIKIKTKYKF